MPAISERQLLIKNLEKMVALDEIRRNETRNDDDNDNDDTATPSASLVALSAVMSNRYLSTRNQVPKLNLYAKYSLLRKLDTGRVRQEIRMSLKSFNILHEMIREHRVYRNTGVKAQTSLKIQMMVALERLGVHGNAGSVGKIARNAGISGRSFKTINMSYHM